MMQLPPNPARHQDSAITLFSGIVQYTNVDANGITHTHWIGQNTQNGVADFINDSGVVQVTFGWGIGADNLGFAQINLAVWVSYEWTMKNLVFRGKPLGEKASQVCVLYDPKGRPYRSRSRSYGCP